MSDHPDDLNWQALFPGRFISAAEFGGELIVKQPTFKIKAVASETLESLDAGKGPRTAGIVYFDDYPRGWVLNKTNAQLVAAMFGDKVSGWTGRRVTLHAARVKLGREMTLGIRVMGSPELKQEMKVQVKLPKRAPVDYTLVPTGQRAPAAPDDIRKLAAEAVRARGWTKEQVLALLGGPAADVPAERRADVVAVLKGPPPPPPEESSGEDDIP